MQADHKPQAPELRTRIARAYEVESYGVEHSQYHPGASAEDFDEVFLGTGSSEREALESALESAATAGWSFHAGAPDLEDYSESDSVSEALEESKRDAIGSKPDARFRVVLRPFNGCGPIVLREGLSIVEANSYASDYCAQRERDGFEVSDLVGDTCPTTGAACASFELQLPESGVSDSEGFVSAELEPESREELEAFERAEERFDEEPSELWYFVSLRVSQAPEGEAEGELVRYEDEDGGEYLFAPDFETAKRAALERARESLWAFRFDFLANYFESQALREDGPARAALWKSCESLCEDAAPIFEALLGSNLERALEAALQADGIAHFLASYDGQQLEDSDGALRFRIN